MQFRRRLAETGEIVVETRGGPDEEWRKSTSSGPGQVSRSAEAQETEQAAKRDGSDDSFEVTIANHASGITGIRGGVSPPVVGVGTHRPTLEHVSGPRLREALDPFGSDAESLIHDAVALLACLHAHPAPLQRPAAPENPQWEPIPYMMYAGMTAPQRGIMGDLHRDTRLCSAGKRAYAEAKDGDVWCHGDASSRNFIITADSAVLVDWECSGLARPEVDLGALLSSVLFDVLHTSLSQTENVRREVAVSLARFRYLHAVATSGYSSAGGRELDLEVLGARIGSLLIAQAYGRCAYAFYDRLAATLMSIGRSLVDNPRRWAAMDDGRQGVHHAS